MTNPAILEALARAILQNSNADISPTPDLPSDKNPIVKLMREWETAMSQAAAVLELVGPRELEWGKNNGAHCRCMTDDRYSLSYWPREKVWVDHYTTMRRHPTLKAAQAAAQAHADAAHWANTPLGDMIGGE